MPHRTFTGNLRRWAAVAMVCASLLPASPSVAGPKSQPAQAGVGRATAARSPESRAVFDEPEPAATPSPDATTTPARAPAASSPMKMPKGAFNVALLGIDTRPQFRLKNTDVIIIASVNPDAPAVTLLAIPRDTVVYVPNYGYTKINQAYALGGIELLKDTIRHNFGLEIKHYALVNFAAIVNTVDALDGVDIVATCPLYHVFPKDPYYFGDPYYVSRTYTDTFSGEVWPAGTRVPTATIDIPKPGIYTLNGLQALAYARARYGVPGGDLDRGRREQRVVRAIFAKAKRPSTISQLPALYSAFRRDFETDLGIPDLLELATLANRFNDTVIRSRFLDAMGASGSILPDGSLMAAPIGDYPALVEQMLNVALNQRPNDGIPVEVLNGTNDPAFGLVVADRLSELGLRVVSVKPAGKLYAKTMIVDYTTSKKGSIIPLLQRTFNINPANVIAEPAKTGVRYRVIAGEDFNPCYYR